jgi:predicted amidohydrolase
MVSRGGADRSSAPAPDVTVAVCQLGPVLGEVAANLRTVEVAVLLAAAAGAEVVVLPELVTTGYAFESAQESRSLAERADGPSLRAIAALAAEHDLVIVGGFAELAAGQQVYNSAFLIDRSGLRAVYRKVHLWADERRWFTPGRHPAPVVDTDRGRIGILVCYDLEFPEWPRIAALAGADLLAVPTNWPASPVPRGERPIEVIRAQASASVDRVFVAVCDRVGPERGMRWVGGSAIIGPHGYPLALAEAGGGAQTLLARCALAQARDKSTSAVNDVVADRRPELYGRLTAAPGMRP